jgi:hypothetical protein
LFLSNCSSLKVIPDRVENSQISFDQNDQNAGVLDFKSGVGWQITENAAKRYVALTSEYGPNLIPKLEKGEGLIIDPPNYYLPNQYMVKFATLNQKHREGWR